MSGDLRYQADAVVVGAGLAGLVAACELADRGGLSWFWIRKARRTWAGRRSGRWAACSWWTHPSSGA